jgi:three-Cys-motif partner protein
MARDIHKAPFDEGTKAKLSIFQDYLKEWLPVFLAKKEIYWNTINVFDFFAGPGSDSKGNKGTPLIILEELKPYIDNITQKNLKVNLYFNEYSKVKHAELKSKLRPEKEDLKPYSIDIESFDFKESFERQFPKMGNKNCVNLLFLDQNGIKHISEEVFYKITNLKRTDFLFFISSSTIKRFSEHPNIIQHIKLSPEEIEKTPYHKIHRLILDYYRSLIPKNKEYYLASFSLRKNAGVYGLIFGSGHVLGIEKFLTTCWNIDPERGEANFDIDDDRIIPRQADLFTGEVRKPKKVDLFEKELREKILNRELKNDRDIYLFTLTNGFTTIHTRRVISKLVADKKIIKCSLTLSNKICKANAVLSEIKFN